MIYTVCQIVLFTNFAIGGGFAAKVRTERLEAAFDFMFQKDPFSGHVVLRSADAAISGAEYKLWTTLKVPTGTTTLEEHCRLLSKKVGAEGVRLMPAKGIFALGVGHVRRKALE